MAVVVWILKMIGLLLLILLGLLVFLVLNLLLNPVRYRLRLKYETELVLELFASWLFHLLTIRGTQTENGFKVELRILGIPKVLYGGEEAREEEEPEPRPETREEKKETQQEPREKIHREVETETEPRTELEQGPEQEPEEEYNPTGKTDTKEEGRLKRIYQKGKEGYQRIKGILTDEENQSGAKSILKEVKYLLRHYAPSKVKAKATFSAGDPALTGQALGIISLIPAVYHYDINLYPDFERDEIYAQGEVLIRGHVRAVHLARSGLHLFRDKKIKKMIHKIKNR